MRPLKVRLAVPHCTHPATSLTSPRGGDCKPVSLHGIRFQGSKPWGPGESNRRKGVVFKKSIRRLILISLLVFCSAFAGTGAEEPPIKAEVHWDKVIRVQKTVPALLYIGTPLTKRGAPLHDPMLKAIKDMGADDLRYAPCNLYPRLSIAELEPPTKTSTSWDFSLIDPYTEDAMAAANGHSVEFGLTTIPEWMFKTPKPVTYPADPEKLFYDYEQGTELRDPTYREVADRSPGWWVGASTVDSATN